MQCCFWHFQYVKGILRFTSSYICTFPMKLIIWLCPWWWRYQNEVFVFVIIFHKAKSSIQILQLLQQWFFGPEQKQWLSVLQVQYGTTILVLWLNKQILSTNWAQITFTALHAEEQQWLSDLWDGRSGPVREIVRASVSVSEWLFGSFVLILILTLFGDDLYFSCFNSHISKEWDGNALLAGD